MITGLAARLRPLRRGFAFALAAGLIALPEASTQTQTAAVAQAEELEDLASKLQSEGKFKEGIDAARKALSLRESAVGRDDPSVATTLTILGTLQYSTADLNGAADSFQRTLTIRERALGPDDVLTAQALNNLALVYLRQGNSVRAEPLLERALTIRRKVHGDNHPEVAAAMNNLAEVYLGRGNFGNAEPLLKNAIAVQEALAAKENPPGSESLQLGRFLNNLGRLYQAKEDLVAAEEPYKRSLEIREKTLKPDHPDIARALNALAVLYQARGELDRAEPLYKRALTIYEASLGPDNPSLAPAINSLAVLYLLKADFDRARPLYLRALDIRERRLGPRHPDVATALAAIAVLYQLTGETDKAVEAQRRSVDIRDANASLILAAGSEQQKLQYMDTLQEGTDITLSMRRQFDADPGALRMAVTTVLRRKGRVLDAMVDSTASLRRRLDADGQELIDQLSASRAQLARLAFQVPSANARDAHANALAAAEADVERLEKQLAQKSAAIAGEVRSTTIADVQQSIPADALLLEFVRYRPFDPKATKLLERFGEARYAAFVMGKDLAPRWFELGPAEPIEKSVTLWRAALRNPSRTDVRTLGRAVDRLVMSPLRQAGLGRQQLLISPDGSLNLIPFAALVDEHDKYLVDRYQISYLTSGRDLQRLGDERAAHQNALVIANPAFAAGGTAQSSVQFGPLPGTAAEAAAIAKLLPRAQIKTGADASESAVKAAHGPSILHIASHGFFFDSTALQPDASTRGLKPIDAAPPQATLQFPLLRSGLALAGANARQGGDGEDGLLTAIEAASLDLTGTRLVVLSACETGVGEVKSGDGVHGLRRAFAMAGAETVVMSLWPVSDTATTDLMVGYYEHLLAGQGRAAALRDVQLRLLKEKRRSHPFYWASFVTAGRWSAFDPRGAGSAQ